MNGFRMTHLIRMDDLGVPPFLGNLHVITYGPQLSQIRGKDWTKLKEFSMTNGYVGYDWYDLSRDFYTTNCHLCVSNLNSAKSQLPVDETPQKKRRFKDLRPGPKQMAALPPWSSVPLSRLMDHWISSPGCLRDPGGYQGYWGYCPTSLTQICLHQQGSHKLSVQLPMHCCG